MKKKNNILFNVVNTRKRFSIYITGSPTKALRLLKTGIRIEVFKDNVLYETIYNKNRKDMEIYIEREKNYHKYKQNKKKKKK